MFLPNVHRALYLWELWALVIELKCTLKFLRICFLEGNRTCNQRGAAFLYRHVFAIRTVAEMDPQLSDCWNALSCKARPWMRKRKSIHFDVRGFSEVGTLRVSAKRARQSVNENLMLCKFAKILEKSTLRTGTGVVTPTQSKCVRANALTVM